MTREQFYDQIEDFEDLIEFCDDYDCHECEDVVRDRDLSDMIDDDIRDALTYDMWYEIRDALAGICADGFDYFRKGGVFDYTGLDDYDFEEYKAEVAEWAERNDIFDEGDEDERDDEEQPVESVDEQDDEELCDEVSFEEFSALLCEAV